MAASSTGRKWSTTKKGQSARERLNRNRLGELPKRTVDPLEILRQAEENRVASLLPIKHSRMAASAFAFFRGAVSVMAADLAAQANTGIGVQLCGDAHLQNMGSFETPDGHIAFDINDFDETTPGPWEWDVKRMATSIALAGGDAGQSAASTRQAVEGFLESYCVATEEAAAQPILVAARRQIHELKNNSAVKSAFEQARRATPLELLAKYTQKDRKKRIVFRESPPKAPRTLWQVTGEERESVLRGVAEYTRTLAPDRAHLFQFFRELDVAFKVVGTGSVGLRDYIVLMEGNGPEDPLFLQIKQEVPSAYKPYLKVAGPSHKGPSHEGQRVAEGQRRIQPVSDLLLGWTRIGGDDYLVRQMNDHKGSIDITTLRGNGLHDLAVVAGHLLARGHARSGDAVLIRGYIGSGSKVVTALTVYALEYADLTRKDYKTFCEATAGGEGKIKRPQPAKTSRASARA